MVDDRITDGKRIGQLLASEVTGLERGALGTLSVVDADPDVDPTPGGAFAFGVEADGTRLGEVHVTPETARLTLTEPVTVDVGREDVTVEAADDGAVVVAHSGAAVKALVDVLADRLG
ncbi:hypothetical protein [Haloarcula pellucida]|uniref:DUF7993 domain-containing protein n=1 Tax=Haloarcula pellucida TaxID=1427151 RepID=A0A830GN51_9EURY|nr:hypothetical protein [Halomicroarcula pellucida]MBX0348149.1 hypothetical protein [Halomicroarcula pellucida]GGN97203.1 hypothetical protein GCM10009030_26210 [Halomicroarcula pellucida]